MSRVRQRRAATSENMDPKTDTRTTPAAVDLGSGALLAALGGSMCVNGEVLTGQRALDYLETMHPVDRGSLIEDLRSLEMLK